MDRQLAKLIGAAFQESPDESALEELNARLETDSQACRDFVDYCRVHGDLHFLISSDSAEERVLDNLGSATLTPRSSSAARSPRSAPSSPTTESSVTKSPATAHRDWLRKSTLGLLALAASMLVFYFGWYSQSQDWDFGELTDGLRRPNIVASIVSVDGAVWEGASYRQGESVRVGSQLHLREGIVKMSMPTGADVVLQGPCDVLLTAPDKVSLTEGRVTAQVADWAIGFAVETPAMKIIDLGTQFAVETDAAGNTEAHVMEGHVRVQPHSQVDDSRSSYLLTAGQAIRVSPQQMTTTRLIAEQERFITNVGAFRPYRPIEIHNTGKGLAQGDEDVHWRIVNGPLGGPYQGPQYAVVCEADERYLPNNPEISQWMSAEQNLRPGCLPNSTYTFQTEFNLTGYDLSTVVILADVLADNGVEEVRINGHPVALEPWTDNEYLQEFRRYRRAEIVEGFVEGKNVIEIDIWNGVYHFEADTKKSVPSPNPMAIRVEWQAFGIPLTTESIAGDVTI